ncbi:MAG: hypothetical protein Mars2KO_38790 [Maribacter sp.]
MELKKNPKKDLNRNSGMYFAMGLFLVLILTYVALEWKSFYGYDDVAEGLPQEELWEQAPPITFVTPPPPPPTPVAPPVLDIVDNEVDVEEVVIASTESDEETEVIEVDEVEFDEGPVDVVVPFSVIENVPVFPGCENDADKRACFNKMMKKHIVKNFRYPELEQEMGIQGRVNIMFEIQKDGSIGNVRMRGPNKNLEKDAARIINKLPKMTPGKQRGNPVRVPFSIPITYKLSN